MEDNKIWFCSYGNQKFKNSIVRIAQEAKNFGFDEVVTYTTSDLPDDLIQDPVMKCARGGGYYVWKPYIIYKTLERMNNGDILIYLDAGCTIRDNMEAKKTFNRYIDILRNESPILTCLTAKKPRIAGYVRFYEYQWTKMDLFEYLDAKEFKDEIQICSGFVGIRKCDDSMEFIAKWRDTMRIQNCHMARDSPSVTPNYPGFVEHRHDQSVLSLLTRKYGYKVMEDQILTYDVDKFTYPFWAIRARV